MTAICEHDAGSNRIRTLRFRDEVLRHLRTRGLMVGRPLLPESGPFKDGGEIEGFPGWTILARRQRNFDLSGSLDLAKLRAQRAGNPHAAIVLYRRAHDTANAYTVLSLDSLASLLSDGQEMKPEGAQL